MFSHGYKLEILHDLLHGIEYIALPLPTNSKLKAQSHFITLSIRSMPLQFVDGKIIPWIKHSQKETNERRKIKK
jgi:hypothetical protein